MIAFWKYILLFILTTLLSCNTENDIRERKIKNNNYEKIQIKYGNKDKKVPLKFEVTKQKLIKRKWRTINTISIIKIGGINDTTFAYPTQIEIDEKGAIYILDMQDCSIIKINLEGVVIRKYGRKGKGPGEFISPLRIDVHNNKVAVIDPNLKKCVVFDKKDIFEVPLKFAPMDVSFISNSEIATLQVINSVDNSIIQRINFKKKQVTEFENIVDTENLDSQILGVFPFLNGSITNYNLSEIVYIPNILNYFIRFSKNGNINGAFNTIDKKNKNVSEIKSQSIFKFPHPKDFVSSQSGIFGDNLFIISNVATLENKIIVVDFYSLDSGMYQFSVKLTEIEEIIDIKFTDDKIFVVKKNTEVEIFDYRIMEED